MTEKLLLGKDLATGEQVFIEPFNTVITGQTQLSGKTTTIRSLVVQAVKLGYTILMFDSKPTMRELDGYYDVPICYRSTNDPLVLIGLLEGIFRHYLTKQYPTLMTITETGESLEDFMANAQHLMEHSKSQWTKDSARVLADMLRRLNNEISQLHLVEDLQLEDGAINVMPINTLSDNAQQLVLKTAFELALRQHNKRTILVIDEASKFLPQDWGSACKRPIQEMITQGARTELFTWLGCQFLAPTEKDPLKACPNKILGRQDHNTEIDSTFKIIPGGKKQISSEELMTLKRGEFFFVPLEGKARKIYVYPPDTPTENDRYNADVSDRHEDLENRMNSLDHRLRKLDA